MTNNNNNLNLKKTKNSRYKALVIFIALFVAVIITVLIINFYISTQFTKDATEINLAGRQRMLSQSMAKNIDEMILAQSAQQNIEKPFSQLQNNFILFDNTLTAFTKGGQTTGAYGQNLVLEAVDVVDAQHAITSANKIWDNYKLAINDLIQSDIAPLQSLSAAIAYAKEHNQNILTLMEQLTVSLQENQYDSTYVNISGRQRMLSQRIAKSLFELVNAQSANTKTAGILKSLALDNQAFNDTLDLFRNGGETQTTANIAFMQPITHQNSIDLINTSIQLWQPLSEHITAILQGQSRVYTTIAIAHDLSNRENLNLLSLMNDLTIALKQNSNKRAGILRYIQITGIVLAIFMFSIIVLFFLKHLRKADTELEQSKKETDRILETVNDGLFLLDREHIIGIQHSDALSNIINIEQPAGKNFFSILRKIVPESTLQTAKDYLGLLYGDRVNEELVAALNPLDKVEVYFGEGGMSKNIGYLDFKFKRVIRNDNVSHLLVQVLDITEKVKLEKQLEDSKAKSQAQFDLMLEVLHVEPRILGQFLTITESSLSGINSVLEKRAEDESGYKDKLNEIFRYMHRIKGDAAGLELQGFEQKAHAFEDILEELKSQTHLSGKDFLPLTISLDEFMNHIESLRILIAKLSELHDSTQTNVQTKVVNPNDMKLASQLAVLAKSVALKQDKKVILNIFNEQQLPATYIQPVQDILTQLIRNSIVHGIEKPDTRVNFNKAEEGLITIKFLRDNYNIIITYTDDGKGLLEQTILTAAIKKGLVSRKASQFLSKEQIMTLVFKRGFSTKQVGDEDAGRGVGMDVIVDIIRGMDGKMGMKSVEHKFFKFIFKLPIKFPHDISNTMIERKQ